MMEALLRAFDDAEYWLKGFTRLSYEESFQRYQAQFAPAYRTAVEAAGADGVTALAEELLESMEPIWKRQLPWNRAAVRANCKQVLVLYLTPMLLEEEALRPLAAALRDGWNRRRPKDSYHAAGYQRIRQGFKLTIMGFTIPEKKKEEIPQDDV